MSNIELPLQNQQLNQQSNQRTNQQSAEANKHKGEGNKKPHPLFNPLIIMMLLFGLPYVFGWYFLNQDEPVLFEAPNNQGTLVTPMIPLGQYELASQSGDKLSDQTLAGSWLLITASDKCELTCQQTIFTMRQARKSTGINRKVITPLVIETKPDAMTAFDADLSQAFPKLQIVSAPDGFMSKLKQAHSDMHNSIYMVDPYGNLMMVYPAGTEQTGLMHDLERLLKVNKPKL